VSIPAVRWRIIRFADRLASAGSGVIKDDVDERLIPQRHNRLRSSGPWSGYQT
jgi:hypothetical protein